MTHTANGGAYPTPEERRTLRGHYAKAGLIILVFILIFHGLNFLILHISSGIIGGGFGEAALKAGRAVINADPVMRAVYGYGMPLAGDIAAFGVGLLVTGCPISKKLALKGFNGKDMAVCFVMTFSLSTAAALVSQIILAIISFFSGSEGYVTDSITSVTLANDVTPLWVNILIELYACIIGPVFEELIFRGVLLEALRKYGNAFGIIASSIMFGLAHANYIQFIPAMVIGMVWAYTAVKTGSLIPSMVMHIINNTIASLLMGMIEYAAPNGDNILDLAQSMMNSLPLVAAVMLNMAVRVGCIIASIIIIVRFYSSGKRLFTPDEYCKKRTWKYFLTSLVWIPCILYLGYRTVTSIPL
ncbi:MAG: CPBP family intramembrane metalloprotease [Ruminococcus sp.]|nr:CPBP family intramembrane metalloprotease [Ruminococcus sp.]